MAITPNNYPFSGGAFINGSNTPVNREDIHTLTLTKGGSSLGQYNPLIGDTTIGIPNDASDDTSTFTKASGDTSSMTSGSKLSALFTAISSFFASMLSSLGGKADKVQGAPAGNLASLDASGNLANSGKKASDFKTKQTAVEDPAPDGFGLSFIDSVSQNTNGELTPHKKTVQDGTTAQKGVVQLQDSIGSTESVTDKAVTPHAVRVAIDAAVSSAYHAAGTKTVAQLTDSLLIAENEGCVYNVTDSGTTTDRFVDGAGHPINTGDNVGVCDVGGGVYKFDLLSGFVDLSNYLTKTGDARNTTSTLTKNTSDTSSMTSGGKLSELFTAISDFFASLKALAFKDTVGTSDIADDAITAAKVKDNETLPVNISGTAGVANMLTRAKVSSGQSNTWWGIKITHRYTRRAAVTIRCLVLRDSNNDNVGIVDIIIKEHTDNDYNAFAEIVCTNESSSYFQNVIRADESSNVSYIGIYVNSWGSTVVPMIIGDTEAGYSSNDRAFVVEFGYYSSAASALTSKNVSLKRLTYTTDFANRGSTSKPVYVDTDGSMKECGFSVNFGTPIAGANVLNIITA